jgi:hypothetical protein
MAEREGWEIVGEFADEAFSAYHGNRGPGLDRAKALAVDTAHQDSERRCILVTQDADRFARGAGDAPGAADHLGEVYFAMKRQRVELWTVRSGHLDSPPSRHRRRALDRRERTQVTGRQGRAEASSRPRAPVGALPIGYVAEATVIDGTPV